MSRTEAPNPVSLHKLTVEKFKATPREAVNAIADLYDVVDLHSGIVRLQGLLASNAKIVPIVIGSHQSHADGIGFTEITKQFKDTPFNTVFSDTMLTGEQAEDLTLMVAQSLPILEAERGMRPVSVVTQRDVEKRGRPSRVNKQKLITLLSTAKSGNGLLVWPEGHLEEAREAQREGDAYDRYAPTLPEPRFIFDFIQRWIKRGYEPIVLPVATDGSYKIFDPASYEVSDEASDKVLHPEKEIKLARLYLGNLLTQGDFENARDDYFFMSKIDELLREGRASVASGKI